MVKEFLNNNFKGDKTIWIIYACLLLFSAVEVYSASSYLVYRGVFNGDYNGAIFKHIVFCCMGIMTAFVTHQFKLRRFAKIISMVIFPGLLIWVAAISLAGGGVNGAARWVTIGGINMQPSEFLKLSYIVAIAYLCSKYSEVKKVISPLTGWICAVCAITAGCIFRENASNAVLIVATTWLIFTLAFNKLKWLVFSVAIVGAVAFTTVEFAKTDTFQDIRKAAIRKGGFLNRAGTVLGRLDRFVNEKEPGDEGFVLNDNNRQAIHGKIAIANSRGLGVLPGRSKERDVLPEAFSDFIYAIIIEETGLLGGGFVLALYIMLLYRVGKIIAKCNNRFCSIVAAGLCLMMILQALINTSVAVGLIPVTGQPLPLISRGGTSEIAVSAYFGIIIGISRFECGDSYEEVEEIEPETILNSDTEA